MIQLVTTYINKVRITSVLAKDIIALYIAQAAGYLVPLLTIPYLARVLEPEGFGLMALGLSFGMWVTQVMEYGFQYSATRTVAKQRDDKKQLSEIAAQVFGGQFLIFAGAILLTFIVINIVPVFKVNPVIAWSGLCLGMASGLIPQWYYQGTEQLKKIAVLQVVARLLSLIAIFALVTSSGHVVRVLVIQIMSACVITAAGFVDIYTHLPFSFPKPRQVIAGLREGFTLFASKGMSSFYTTLNSFLLGILAPVAQVALFAGAERVIRPLISFLWPIINAFYPRVARLNTDSSAYGRNLVSTSILIQTGIGVAIGIVVFASAKWIVLLLFGQGYEELPNVLRVLAFLPPVVALGSALSFNLMLPRGLDHYFFYSVAGAAITNVALAFLLASQWGAVGMAWAVVLAETVALVLRLILLKKHAKEREVI